MNNLYLLSGDDEFAKEEYLEKLKENFGELKKGINYLMFDKDNISSLGSEISTYSFFSNSKFIVVNVPKSRKQSNEDSDEEVDYKISASDWLSDDLEEKILDMMDDITLVFIEVGSSKGKLFKFVSTNGKAVSFEKKKPYELVSWLNAYALSKDMQMSKDVCEYFLDVCGSDKIRISNEIEKLISYCDNNVITKNDIDSVCTMTSEVIIFNLTDNLGLRNKKKALENLEGLLSNKEPIQKILVMITRHIKQLIIVKECLEQGLNIEKELGIKSYPATKYKSQVRNFTKIELIKLFKELAELDINSKMSNIDIKVGLQSVLMQ